VSAVAAPVRVLVPAALVAVLGVADAGYFPTTWGWATVVLGVGAAILLVATGRVGSRRGRPRARRATRRSR